MSDIISNEQMEDDLADCILDLESRKRGGDPTPTEEYAMTHVMDAGSYRVPVYIAMIKSLRSQLTTERQEKAALAVRVGEFRGHLESAASVLSDANCPDNADRIEKTLSLPDNAEEVLREHDAKIWEQAANWCMSEAGDLAKPEWDDMAKASEYFRKKAKAARGRKDAKAT